jgi:ABC-type Fe3+-hydroxamate transport system substrate-binding protein
MKARFSKTTRLNFGAAVACLALSAGLALPRQDEALRERKAPILIGGAEVIQQNGVSGMRDATGHFVPLASYRRIVSTSGVSDSVLLALAEPDRIVAFTRYSVEHSPIAYRYAGKPTIAELTEVEAILSRKPDLVLVNNLGNEERIQRLRDVGLTVFDLGEMRGLKTLLPNIVTIGTLLGRTEVGRELASRFERRMQSIAKHIPEAQRPLAVYTSIYGDSLYGASIGTSHHDVLLAAGLRDKAAGVYQDWPRYTPEMLLALDPDVIVTQDGMREHLCRHSNLKQLRACQPGGSIVEVNGRLLDDPSLTMLDAAEAVYEAVHLARPSAP